MTQALTIILVILIAIALLVLLLVCDRLIKDAAVKADGLKQDLDKSEAECRVLQNELTNIRVQLQVVESSFKNKVEEL